MSLYAFQPHMTRRQRLKIAKRSVRTIRKMLGENHYALFLRHMDGNRHNRRMRMTIRQRSARRKQERAEQAYHAESGLEFYA